MREKLENLNGRKYLFAGSAILLVLALSIGLAVDPSSETKTTSEATDWQEIELQDVNSGETFSIAELEKPVLVESFAVWCSTCTRQQQEMKKFHDESNVKSVSLNVDSNEDERKVKEHTGQYSFDWRYAISPTGMTRQFVNRYGNSVAHPPSAPVILVCEDGTRKLPNGVKPVSKLQEEIDKGC